MKFRFNNETEYALIMVMNNSDGTIINKGFCIPPLTSTLIATILASYTAVLMTVDIIGGIQNLYLLFTNIIAHSTIQMFRAKNVRK